jgi:hypothetical protein
VQDLVGGRRGIYEDDQDVDQERECLALQGRNKRPNRPVSENSSTTPFKYYFFEKKSLENN